MKHMNGGIQLLSLQKKTYEGEKLFLHFEGVDCFAEYYLNDTLIGSSDNMFIPCEFDITDVVLNEENQLAVRIRSAVLEENSIPTELFSMNVNFTRTTNSSLVRKAAHSYGWDIFPRAVSAGIWRNVSLVTKKEYDFSQLYFITLGINENEANVQVAFELNLPNHAYKNKKQLEISLYCRDSIFNQTFDINFKAGNVRFNVENPYLWWPYGYGEPNIYKAKASLLIDGEKVCEKEVNYGIRTVELDRTEVADGKNGHFRFLINNTEIMAKGANWVAMDAFHSRDAQRLDAALSLAKDIGCNILRCWGGNVYEDTPFYDFCDANGIMVWQDFAMACYYYPRSKEFCQKMREEATFIVRKFRQHPSLILWSGDNECDDEVKNLYDPNLSNIVTRQIFPDVIASNDALRPYLPSSPFICEKAYSDKAFDSIPERHLWGPRDYYKSDFYKNASAHFVSETGYHGCPSPESIRKFITPEKLWPYKDNDEWILHSSDQKGNPMRIDLMENQLIELFDYVPDCLEEFSLLSQLSQAEAKKYFIERVRIARPKTSGVIWWNLLDGWPQLSDSVVDYYYCKKAAYDYIRISQQPFCIFLDEARDGYQSIIVSNDTLTETSGEYSVCDGETGEILNEGIFNIGKNQNKTLGSFKAYYSKQRLLIIRWNANGKSGANHYISGNTPFDKEKFKKWYEIIKAEVLKY